MHQRLVAQCYGTCLSNKIQTGLVRTCWILLSKGIRCEKTSGWSIFFRYNNVIPFLLEPCRRILGCSRWNPGNDFNTQALHLGSLAPAGRHKALAGFECTPPPLWLLSSSLTAAAEVWGGRTIRGGEVHRFLRVVL